MKISRYTDEQIAFALKQAETGTPVAEVIRRMGIAEQTFYRWKKVYGGLGVGELRRLKQLEDEKPGDPQNGRGTAVGGDLLQWSVNGGTDYIRHLTASGGTVFCPLPASWVPGTFGVIVVSQGASSRLVTVFGPDGATTKITRSGVSGTKTVANPQRKRTLGSVHVDIGGTYGSNEIASFVNWSSALTEGQISSRAYDMLDYARSSSLISSTAETSPYPRVDALSALGLVVLSPLSAGSVPGPAFAHSR
ncbi:hypothetical protein HMP09_0283 [Sphingomonas sp. HMP9]|nr:hypothetical protein HMP09_0283 [Sphingomonas sp. HMP9]